MSAPNLFWARQLKEWPCETAGKLGVYHMARPIGFQGMFLPHRIRLAWGVFTGKYDAVRWSELP